MGGLEQVVGGLTAGPVARGDALCDGHRGEDQFLAQPALLLGVNTGRQPGRQGIQSGVPVGAWILTLTSCPTGFVSCMASDAATGVPPGLVAGAGIPGISSPPAPGRRERPRLGR